MTIEPLPGIIQLELEEAKAGVLDTSSRQSAVEYAKVVAVGGVTKIDGITVISPEVGDHVFVKSWAVDIITHEDKKYYFVDSASKGVLAVVK